MKKIAFTLYGTICYLLFNAVFLYLIAFQQNILVPKTIDGGIPTSPTVAALINIGLITLFGAAHSIMARDSFKKWWTRVLVSPTIERSTYVLQASLLLALIIWQWRPMPTTVWQVTNLPAQIIFYVLFGIGVCTILLSTFLINHFELFGLQQVVANQRNKPMPQDSFKTPFLYKYVRHPMQLGVIIMAFATPHMTVGHLLFAVSFTGYILVGLHFEEKALVRRFGDTYRYYQQTTPKLIPTFGLRFGKTARPEPAEGTVSPTHQS